MNNAELSNVLEDAARALEFCNEPPFIVDAYWNASKRVAALDVPLEVFAGASRRQDEENLAETLRFWLGDIHPDVLWNLERFIATGVLPLRERLANVVTDSALELLRLKTLDQPTVFFLREEMNLRNVAALKAAATRGHLSRSNRFSRDKEREILDEIQRLEESRKVAPDAVSASGATSDAVLLAEIPETLPKIDDSNLMFGANAAALADLIVRMLTTEASQSVLSLLGRRLDEEGSDDEPKKTATYKRRGFFENMRRCFSRLRKITLRQVPGAPNGGGSTNAPQHSPFLWTRLEKVGAVRRLQDCVSRLDFLIETNDPEAAFEQIEKSEFVRSVLKKETFFLSVVLRGELFELPYNDRPTPDATLNFYAATNCTFGTRELLTTSTPEHWRALRDRAEKRGWNLTAFGLYSGTNRLSSRRSERIYEKLGLPFVPPELRANRVEWDWIDSGAPELLTLEDLRGDLHLHSRFTDGVDEIDEIVASARNLGLDYIALTDHTQNVESVGGMNDAEFLRYWDYIDDFNRKMEDSGVLFRVLKGAEVDILDDGSLDLKDETLARADWIVASVHFGLEDSSEKLRNRYLSALSSPFVDAIAHPTERIIGTRAPMKIDVDFLCSTAAKYGKFLELNSQPRRLDLNVDGLIAAKKAGVPIVVSTDSHSIAQMPYLRFGVEQTRRAGLTKADVANAAPLNEFLRRRNELRTRFFGSGKSK